MKLIYRGIVPLEKIPYVDHPEIRVDEHETTEMPFRYVKGRNGFPVMPEVSPPTALKVKVGMADDCRA